MDFPGYDGGKALVTEHIEDYVYLTPGYHVLKLYSDLTNQETRKFLVFSFCFVF